MGKLIYMADSILYMSSSGISDKVLNDLLANGEMKETTTNGIRYVLIEDKEEAK